MWDEWSYDQLMSDNEKIAMNPEHLFEIWKNPNDRIRQDILLLKKFEFEQQITVSRVTKAAAVMLNKSVSHCSVYRMYIIRFVIQTNSRGLESYFQSTIEFQIFVDFPGQTHRFTLPLYPHDSLKNIIRRTERLIDRVAPVSLRLKQYRIGSFREELYYDTVMDADFRTSILTESDKPLLILLGDLHQRWSDAGGSEWFQVRHIHTKHKLRLNSARMLSTLDQQKLSRIQTNDMTDKPSQQKQFLLNISDNILGLEQQTRNKHRMKTKEPIENHNIITGQGLSERNREQNCMFEHYFITAKEDFDSELPGLQKMFQCEQSMLVCCHAKELRCLNVFITEYS